ncbi:protein lava lamp isoform X2 [Euwallacea fornicatus]|uniref:protein lava lamp isoform X2 n=1 Tax=Euwallacea fornicatus TaxID=995702 RepID=UPI00338D85E5
MWGDQNPDPGGTEFKEPSQEQALTELKDQNEQQLVLIAQLKEMLRKEQSSVSHDKVEEYVNTLNKARAKRFKQKKGEASSSPNISTSSANIDANKKERMNLLRQQLEENKAKLAERGKSQKGIEEMVSQMQAQLKDSQVLAGSSSHNSSFFDVKNLEYNENTPQKEVYNILLIKERKIAELLSKSQKLEGIVIDLQDNLKEKDSVIDARTKAITLMSDSLSKKGKRTLDALEETKEQMRQMQENFVTLEAEMKARQLSLLNDLKVKNFEITELQDTNKKLELERVENMVKISSEEGSDITEALHKEIENIQLEKQHLAIKLEEVINENSKELLKMSQLENDPVCQSSKFHDELNALKLKLEETKLNLKTKTEENEQILTANKKLIEENSEHLVKIGLLEEAAKVSAIFKENSSTVTLKDENEEISKLKKQLDESNKSMIKMRAVQKGKVKELNKKLDQFKKMNDSNALITQLQNEISKLNEKVAELEDEKGNLQLKMVDSTTSSKEDQSDTETELKHLKDKLDIAEQQLDEKDKVIQILEKEVLSLKDDLKLKAEEEVKVSSQVSSEMSSIYYEEQIEELEHEESKLNEQINLLKVEKEGILQELENAKKEKQELNSKLEIYIQENMDLIDKLEKLSAEKVSSAESIEIVEGLTQQEKLELAAYQKHLNPEDISEPHLKSPEDDPPAELNETVLQLNEDTAELLQKIDMFTQERKEVMQKMEALKEENCTLNVKLQEIENNRDILEETYEQLQNEKEQLEHEKEELSAKLTALEKNKLEEGESAHLTLELKELQAKFQILIQENDRLKQTLKDFNSVIQEKYDLETKLGEVVENNTNLDSKLNSDLDEINNYQLIIEENKTELIKSADEINRLQTRLEERERDIQELHINISELNSVIDELQNKEGKFETIGSELDELKLILKTQIERTNEYEEELANNNQTIQRLNEEILAVNRRIFELDNQLELKEGELEKLAKEINNKDATIKGLQGDIEEKDRSFKTVSEDMKEKYLQLQQKLDNDDKKLALELSNRNKEQLEKMKKIAANLKKKTQAYQELEEAFKAEKERWESEDRKKMQIIEWKTEERASLSDELRVLREEIETLQQINAEQQQYIQELKHKEEKLLETNLQQEMSASLHENPPGFLQSNPDDKIRELELLVETNEGEIMHYKERVSRLEKDVRKIQEVKVELEAVNSQLNEKLDLTSNDFKEKTLLQDELEMRLSEITSYNEALQKKWQKTLEELSEIRKKNNEQEELVKKLKYKLKKSHDRVSELKGAQESLQELESVNEALKNHVTSLEENQRHIQSENEALQRRNVSDYEKFEYDYQVQLEALIKAKNDLTVDNEKLQERVKELEEREQELGLEIADVRKKMEETEEVKMEEVRALLEDLQTAKERNNELNLNLQECYRKIEELSQEVELARQSFATLETQLEEVVAEKVSLQKSLEESQKKLEEQRRELQGSQQESGDLRFEIQALEFAKDTLEASCKSSQKLEYFQAPEALTSTEGLKLTVVTNVEEDHNLTEIKLLRAELTRLQQENHALLFANSSLEASYESTQKPVNVNLEARNVVAESQQEIPVFSEFGQQPLEAAENWFEQQSSQAVNRPPNIEISRAARTTPVIEEGREALLQKIKALEFLLYSVDKEKEIALDQCTEMVNTLTEMIYDRPKSDLESQILAPESLEPDKQALQALEFTPTYESFGTHSAPIEEIVQAKKAYICFDDKDPKPSSSKEVESQIMSEVVVAEQKMNKREMQKLEFEATDQGINEQKGLAVEPQVQSKHAYLCYNKEDKPQSLEAFEENDDGWAWGPEEARLEAEHLSSQENIPQVKNLLLEVQQLKESIKILQIERENHLEEIKQLQVKSGKLIKKCKELKAKKPDDGGFFDLNETIQEELKGQVHQLEKRVKELSSENEKEKTEKSSLLKRVDVLTTANDRLTEMKEIQDAEVHRLQRKCEDTTEKLKEFEWTHESSVNPQEPTTSNLDQAGRIKELEETIKDLSLDNEELQTLLEEQTAKRLESEKNKSSGNEEELKELRNMNQNLHKELEEVKQKIKELQGEKRILVEEKAQMEKTLRNTQAAVFELERHMAKSQTDLEEKQTFDLEIQQKQIIELQSKLDMSIKEKSDLQKLLAQTHDELTLKIEENQIMNSQLNQAFGSRFETSELRSQIDHLNMLLHEKDEIISRQNGELEVLQNQLHSIASEKNNDFEAALQVKIEQIQQSQEIINELQERIKELEGFAVQKNALEQEKQILHAQLQQRIEEKNVIAGELELNKESLALITQEIEQLKKEKLSKDVEIQRFLMESQNKEQEFQDRVNALMNELNENWQVQVDQRGFDVAESWKMHLEAVEKDYVSAQEKLRQDMQELEEKCNVLVNENNALRKNVDQEIKNEVDKMSALQQQIGSLQHTIIALNQSLEEKNRQIEEVQNNLSHYSSLDQELDALRLDNAEKEKKLSAINVVIETTQKQFDEKREVVEEIVSILEKNTSSPISYEKLDILQEFQRQLGLNKELEREILTLTHNIQEWEEKLNRLAGEKSREITGLNQVIEDLEKELSVVHEKEAEIVHLNSELMNLQKTVETTQLELEKLRQEHSNCVITIEDSNRMVQEFENLQQSLQQSLYQKDEEIESVKKEISRLQGENHDKMVKEISDAFARLKEEYFKIETSLSQTQTDLAKTKDDLSQQSQTLQSANETILQHQQARAYYEQENSRLKDLIDQRESEYHSSVERLQNNQLSELQRHYEELLSNKDIDVATLRGQIQELAITNQSYAERLNQEIAAKEQVVLELKERTQLVDEDTKQLEELKLLIEDQVVKIEQLKKDLFDKSLQYDGLIAEMDVGRIPVVRQPTPASPNQDITPNTRPYTDDDLTELVSRAELDLALYMLHQRDVRCEELTVELTQLLEERDTLQLRLSNAIREKEELRRLAGSNDNTFGLQPRDSSQIQSTSTHLSTNTTEAAKDSIESEKNLATKLSELRNIGYKKDKTFVDEQETRRLQQLAIMQQHINEASKLPPEAAAKLVDATYTLSRDVQSPSKVLLNWLWGKNPPKANDS